LPFEIFDVKHTVVKTFLTYLCGAFVLSLPLQPLGAEDSILKKATYAHALEENQSPKDTAEFFYPDETIYLSLELKGRPKSGGVTGKFFFKEELIAEATVDVAEVNEGVLFSFGQNTFVGLNLKPTRPLPIGAHYRTEVSFAGKSLGSYPFKVAPPKGAIPSLFKSAALAKGVDEKKKPMNPTRDFTQLDKVVLAGVADLGLGSALEVEWLVNGKPDDAGTKSFVMEENKKDVPFYFSYVPAKGWPVGSPEVVLTIDGKEVSREKFTVKADPSVDNTEIDVVGVTLHRDDGDGEAGEEVEFFSTEDLVLHLECELGKPVIPQGVKFIWTLIKAGDEENLEIAVAEIDEDSLNRSLSTNLTTKEGLPAGLYRVNLVQGEDLLASKKFEVK